MKQWTNDMDKVAKSLKFEQKGFKITSELENILLDVESTFRKLCILLDGTVDGKKATEICKRLVSVYETLQELLDVLLKELNKPSFIAHVHKMQPFFEFLNKVLRMVVKLDLFKIQNPLIFAAYSEHRLLNPKEITKYVEQIEDQKISTYQSVSLPLGRLFLSFFSNSKFDLISPVLLSKISKILIDQEKLDNLGIFTYLARLNNWRYINVVFSVTINRLLNRNVLILGSHESEKLKKYFDLLLNQL